MRQRRVLIVDPEVLVRWSLCQRLAIAGYRVLQASGARAALRLAEEADLVLAERHLPDGDGQDLVVRLRQQRPSRPVIVMTAYASPDLEELVRRGTVDAVLEKPFGLDDVVLLVRASLDPRRASPVRLLPQEGFPHGPEAGRSSEGGRRTRATSGR